MTLPAAAKELLSLIDAVGPPSDSQADRVFAQFEFDNLRAAVEAHDAENSPTWQQRALAAEQQLAGVRQERDRLSAVIEEVKELGDVRLWMQTAIGIGSGFVTTNMPAFIEAALARTAAEVAKGREDA